MFFTDTGRLPLENVARRDEKPGRDDCQSFLQRLNATAKVPPAMGRGKFVLPHEGEWEYACRGGQGIRRPFYVGEMLNGGLAECGGCAAKEPTPALSHCPRGATLK
jgi:hypothetical protein